MLKMNYHKYDTIYNWKTKGLIGDYDEIFTRYINTTNCDRCDVLLTKDKYLKPTTRCMDHSHKTNLFRNIICHNCNCQLKQISKVKMKNNKSGFPNIIFDKKRSRWVFYKTYKKKRYFKRFKTLREALVYKFTILILLTRKPA